MDVWQGSEYASELASKVKDVSVLAWISKVADNLLLGNYKKKEPNELQNSWTHPCPQSNFKIRWGRGWVERKCC